MLLLIIFPTMRAFIAKRSFKLSIKVALFPPLLDTCARLFILLVLFNGC